MTIKYELETQKNYADEKKCGVAKLLIPCCTTLLLSLNFFDLSSTTFGISLFSVSLFLCFSVSLCLCVKVDCGCSQFGVQKLANSSVKWKSPSQIWRVEQQNQSFLANWTDCAVSYLYLLWFEGSLSVHLALGFTAPCGRPSASLEFRRSLIPPHYACCISACCCPRHNPRRHSLSMLVLSYSGRHKTSKGIWYSAGTTESWFLVLQLSCFCRISLMCRELPHNSLRSFASTLVLVVVDSSWLKIEESLHKMTIALEHWWVEQRNHPFLINWPAWALCSQYLFRLNVVLSVHLWISVPLPRLLSFVGSTAPFGRPSASLEFFHSLILPHYHSASLPAAVQNTTPEGVLSSCGCSLTLTLTTSTGICHDAGVTKGVISPAAHRGIWHAAGATKCSTLVIKLSCSCWISLICR